MSYPAILLLLLLHACALTGEEAGRSRVPGYAHQIPPGSTFDLRRGEAISPEDLAGRLRGARLLFLGENHTDTRSHRFQIEAVKTLLRMEKKVVIALEMLPPSVNGVLEEWRRGKLDEESFLERTKWFEHWGFPWGYYRELFQLFRERQLPLRGINAEKATRLAVRKGKWTDLSPQLQEELGDLESSLPPHRRYVFDVLSETGHGSGLRPGSSSFRSYYRVQRMWDRLMGLRSARLAEEQATDGVTVVLIGSGHLAFGLGANLQAARVTRLPRLSLWDQIVDPEELDSDGSYRVPLGMADLARIYVGKEVQDAIPSLLGLQFATGKEGETRMEVKSVRVFESSPLSPLRVGDVALSLNGQPFHSEIALRLAYERLQAGEKAKLTVLRKGAQITLDITPRFGAH